MKKIKSTSLFADTFSSSKVINFTVFFMFTVLLTVVLSSKYVLFQSIINDDGTSKKDITAYKTIKVVDTFRTNQHKKEIYQKIEPVFAPAEDSYMKNNFHALELSIKEIRAQNRSAQFKKDEIALLFDFSNSNQYKNDTLDYLVTVGQDKLEKTFRKADDTLDTLLSRGITEKDLEQGKINSILLKYASFETSKRETYVIAALLEQIIVPNMVVDEDATELARKNAVNSISPIMVKFDRGDRIVSKGELVTKVKRDALQKAGYNVLRLDFKGVLGIFFLVAFGVVALMYYLRYFENSYITREYLSIIALLSLVMSICAAALPDGWSYYYLPFPAVAMLLSLFLNPRISFLATAILITIISISVQMPLQPVAVFFIISLIAAISTAKIAYSRRFDLLKTGFKISIAMLLFILNLYLIENCVSEIDKVIIWNNLLVGFLNGLLSGIFVLGTVPLLESWFKILTPYGLSELADTNQELLKRMQRDAPGTSAHSLAVAHLAEAAAEAIGANPVLARVGAMYHDIGKLKRPLFFVENQTYWGIENPHTKLNPRLSKMVITAHPKDGLDIAREYGLPPVIQNFIIQHHGDSVASYFYNQAKHQEGEEKVTEEQFRYTCPKPASKEVAILMITDAVESASRTLKDFSQESLDAMINKIIQDRLNDGQLSETPLTLKDLKTIAETLSNSLRAEHHQRIKYHEDILQELEDNVMRKRFVAPDKIASDDELKIEKKIQKRINKNNE